MTRFWLIRHGPTHQKTMTGWRDVPVDLSDKAAIARLVAALPKGAVRVSSDLVRAAETAWCLPGDPVPPRADIREINFGDWDGRGAAEISAEDPDLSRAFWETPGEVAPPNGESWNAFQGRVAAALDDLATTYEGRDVILVAHFGVVVAALGIATKMPAASSFSFKIDPLSLTRIDRLDGGHWAVQGVNHNL